MSDERKAVGSEGLLQRLDDWQEVFADEWGCVKEARDLLEEIREEVYRKEMEAREESREAKGGRQIADFDTGRFVAYCDIRCWLDVKLEGNE